ncbi:MAG: T9SS type A sorting domain-containing protein [Cryomorphaceae bacterium]|nr:T9SS type A sorting domain-containing protein [Flavobacteriales bacterium]
MSLRVFILTAFSVGISASCFAQWNEIAYSESLASGHNDLYFLSNDMGYIAGTELIDSDIQSYILRTYNGGQTWDTTFVQNKIFRAIHFPSMDTGYVAFREGTYIGILNTQDGGNTWNTISDSILETIPVSLDLTFFSNSRGVMAVPGAAYLTNDSGVSWELIDDFPVGNSGTVDSYGQNFASTGGISFVYSDDACESLSSTILMDNSSGIDLSILNDQVAVSFLGQEGGIVNDYPHFNFSRLIFGNFNDLQFSTVDIPHLRSIDDIEFGSASVLYGLSWPNQVDGPRIVKSVDSGMTWYEQGLEEGAEFHYGFHKNLQCLNDSVCYIAFNSVIYKTTNGGGPLLDPIESIVLSVENPRSEIALNVFPNPSTGNITLESESPLKRISVFDAVGRLVFRESIQNKTNQQLNLSHLPKGLYLLQISGQEFEKTEKVVLE